MPMTFSDLASDLYEHFLAPPQFRPRPHLLAGRTVVVTGANTGLGLETAIHLAKCSPARIVIACRNAVKGEAAKTRLVKETGLEAGRVEVWALDLGSFASVKTFAGRCENELGRLDVLIQNAGVQTSEWVTTEDGWEQNLQVNVIATGLLGVLLLPLQARTAKLPLGQGMQPFKPHQTIVASSAHLMLTYKQPASPASVLADLNNPKSDSLPDSNLRYQFTKLADIFIAHQLARLPIAQGVVINSVHPGLCISEFRREFKGFGAWALDALAWPTKKGAKGIAWSATSDTPSGSYVSAAKVKLPSRYARSDEGLILEHDLWHELVEEWVRIAPEVEKVLA